MAQPVHNLSPTIIDIDGRLILKYTSNFNALSTLGVELHRARVSETTRTTLRFAINDRKLFGRGSTSFKEFK